jgi:hypothetical protein
MRRETLHDMKSSAAIQRAEETFAPLVQHASQEERNNLAQIRDDVRQRATCDLVRAARSCVVELCRLHCSPSESDSFSDRFDSALEVTTCRTVSHACASLTTANRRHAPVCGFHATGGCRASCGFCACPTGEAREQASLESSILGKRCVWKSSCTVTRMVTARFARSFSHSISHSQSTWSSSGS